MMTALGVRQNLTISAMDSLTTAPSSYKYDEDYDPLLTAGIDGSSKEGTCEPDSPIAIPIMILLIAVVGLIANAIVIFIVVVLQEYKKSVTNIYVLQLAIADFIFLFQLPFHARTLILGEWTYGVTWCKLSEGIKMLNYYSSVMFLTVMSVDRYLAINFAMNQRVAVFRTKRAAVFISSCLWLLSFISIINILIYADAPECHCQTYFPGNGVDNQTLQEFNLSSTDYYDEYYDYGSGGYELDQELLDIYKNDDTVCSFNKPQYSQYYKNWIVCNFVLAFILPLCVISLSYALIIRRILKPMVVGTKSQKSNKTRTRVTIMVTTLVSAFIICWLPYHAFHLARLNDIKMFAYACDVMTNFTVILAYSNSAVNPFFYTFLGTNFRKRWGNAIGKARKGIRQSILSHSGEYTPGASFKGRRKSSAASTSALKNRDDVSVNSFVTKNTIVPQNIIIKEDKV